MTTNMTADEPNSSSQKESSLPRTQVPMPERQLAETDESTSPLRPPSTLATPPPVPAPAPAASSSVLSEGASSAVVPAAKASAADPKTPPPSPPPLLRRTTGHLPEKRMGSSSSNEYNPSAVSPVSPITSPDQTLKNSDLHALKGTPPTTPERVRKPINNNKSPKSPIINPRRGSASAPTTNPRRGSASASASASASTSTSHPKPKRQPTDLPIPISSADPHHSHDLPIFSPPPAEEKISLHPTTRSHSNASISSLSSSLNERNEEDYSLGTATNVQSTSHSHKHPPKPSSSEAGYKGKLWSDWHWHRNLDLPVQPMNQPGVTEAELEKKKYVSPYPRPVSSGGGGNTARDWKKDLEQAAGWAKEKFGEFGKKLNENMHYGGDSGRGRRNREGNVSYK